MPRNVEIKARLDDPAAVRERLQDIATGKRLNLEQVDTFFAVARGRLKLREFGDGSAELIHYERADEAGPKLSSFERLAVTNPKHFAVMLGDALGVRGKVEKRREVAFVGQTRIHLDDVKHLGTFLELEVMLEDGQTAAAGKEIAIALLRRLGVADRALIEGAYIDLLDADAH